MAGERAQGQTAGGESGGRIVAPPHSPACTRALTLFRRGCLALISCADFLVYPERGSQSRSPRAQLRTTEDEAAGSMPWGVTGGDQGGELFLAVQVSSLHSHVCRRVGSSGASSPSNLPSRAKHPSHPREQRGSRPTSRRQSWVCSVAERAAGAGGRFTAAACVRLIPCGAAHPGLLACVAATVKLGRCHGRKHTHTPTCPHPLEPNVSARKAPPLQIFSARLRISMSK